MECHGKGGYAFDTGLYDGAPELRVQMECTVLPYVSSLFGMNYHIYMSDEHCSSTMNQERKIDFRFFLKSSSFHYVFWTTLPLSTFSTP